MIDQANSGELTRVPIESEHLKELVNELGKPYSEELGIDLRSRKPEEICKWYLASILFAARINETIAKNTYREFEKRGVLSPKNIVETGWDGLVEILDAGGYVRYDFKTADKLLEVFGNLQRLYEGDLNRLHEAAQNPEDLEAKLRLGKGIGEVTVSIFLREMRPCWEKARPKPTPLVLDAMEHLGISSLEETAGKTGLDIVRLETALFRFGKRIRRLKKQGKSIS
jgi:hypothetical protein